MGGGAVQHGGSSDVEAAAGSIDRSSHPRRHASLRIAASWPRRSSRPRWEWSVADPFSMTARLCWMRHFATGTSPMVGTMCALRRDRRPSIVRGCFPRLIESSRYSSPSIRMVRDARTSAPTGSPCSVSSARSACSKILRASSSDAARRSTRFHGSPAGCGWLALGEELRLGAGGHPTAS